ncbi:hypothetical protein L0337_12745 [candidate division KSB1 bacterium]|nr:hypothetical protein [candidate division KSB1 bacterium]
MAAFVKFRREGRREKEKGEGEGRRRRENPDVIHEAFISLFLAAAESGSSLSHYARGIYGFPNLLSILVAKI